MENASKALIIAGEVLIAILVVTLISSIIILLGSFSANMNKQMSEKQIAMFNSNFYNYSGRIDITAGEVASIINLAKERNDKNELEYKSDSIYYINIYMDGKKFYENDLKTYLESGNTSDTNASIYNNSEKFKMSLNNFLKNNNINFFSCDIDLKNTTLKTTNGITNITTAYSNNDINIESSTGLVNTIKFTTVTSNTKFSDFNVKNKSNYTINGKSI